MFDFCLAGPTLHLLCFVSGIIDSAVICYNVTLHRSLDLNMNDSLLLETFELYVTVMYLRRKLLIAYQKVKNKVTCKTTSGHCFTLKGKSNLPKT